MLFRLVTVHIHCFSYKRVHLKTQSKVEKLKTEHHRISSYYM